MERKLKILLIAGARPNFMKIAPLVKAVQIQNQTRQWGKAEIDLKLIHTGQHYDRAMSEVFFRELGIPEPDINLEVGSGSHAVQTANVMTKFEPVCERERPDWVFVVGDVNSTLACTFVATKLGVRVAHVEAGLRSFDRTMPEEINRVVTDLLADLLFTPSPDADENLRKEGIPDSKIRCVGNIMIDALVANLSRARSSKILETFGLDAKHFAYVTLHRPSNVDDESALAFIIAQLQKLAKKIPVAFPMHPRTRKMATAFGIVPQTNGHLKILEPIGYHDSLCLAENARLVLTDSGGLQEETTFFRTPCLTLRPNTERPITVTLGTNRLTNIHRLESDLEQAFEREPALGKVPPLWDGHTAPRILSATLAAVNG